MRRAVLLALAIAIAVGGVLAGLVVSGAIGQDNSEEPLEKQAIETEVAARDATYEAAAQGITKQRLEITPIPTPQSCPVSPFNYPARLASPPVYAADARSFRQAIARIFGDYESVNLASQALGLTSEGAPYAVYSGALTSDPQQGAIGVSLGDKDPCADGRTEYPPEKYMTPFKGGAVTLTKVVGDAVDFQTADGTTGRLNFVTGTFR